MPIIIFELTTLDDYNLFEIFWSSCFSACKYFFRLNKNGQLCVVYAYQH